MLPQSILQSPPSAPAASLGRPVARCHPPQALAARATIPAPATAVRCLLLAQEAPRPGEPVAQAPYGRRTAPDPFESPADSPLGAVLRELRNDLYHDMVSVLNVFANSGETN